MNGFNVTRRSTNMLWAACDGGSSRPIDVYPCRDGMRRGFFYAPRPRDTARSPDRLVATGLASRFARGRLARCFVVVAYTGRRSPMIGKHDGAVTTAA